MTRRRYRVRTGRRYPLAPLERALGTQRALHGGQAAPNAALALCLGSSRNTVLRLRRSGLTPAQADSWAVRAGLHPSQVWPTWIEDAEDDLRLAEWWERLDRYRVTVRIAEAA